MRNTQLALSMKQQLLREFYRTGRDDKHDMSGLSDKRSGCLSDGDNLFFLSQLVFQGFTVINERPRQMFLDSNNRGYASEIPKYLTA